LAAGYHSGLSQRFGSVELSELFRARDTTNLLCGRTDHDRRQIGLD